jgi:hypothetical protein
MELGPYNVQVFTSLVVILAAACVALICDFLKGNNEQLRELTIELKVRREEEHKRIESLMPHVLATPQGRIAARMLDEAPAAVVARSAAGTSRREHAPRSLAISKDRKRTAAPEALAAMERGAKLAGTPRAPRAAASAQATMPPSTSPKPQLVETASKLDADHQRIPEQVLVDAMAASAGTRPAASSLAAKQVILRVASKQVASKKDWSALLAAKRSTAQSSLLTAVMEATATDQAKTGASGLPAGFQDGFVVAELIAKKQPVNGLVMSVGISARQLSMGTLPESVHQLMQSLLGENDFATQSKPDEFLLIFPEERGAAAQRRLNQVAQHLWDFQLRSLGTDSVVFNWGGLEVRGEPINEAIASANERMQETRRGRKHQGTEAPVEFEEPSRRAM